MKIQNFLLVIPVALTAMSIVASPQMPVGENSGSEGNAMELTPEQLRVMEIRDSIERDSIARADSIAQAYAMSIFDKACDNYKKLKIVQYDGVTEAELYPRAIACYDEVTGVMENERIVDNNRNRLKGILFDINPLLMSGAVYYSSEGDAQQMNRFAKAAVDTRMRDDMGSFHFGADANSLYPSLIYCAASQAYNSGDYSGAIGYFEEYLDTDDNAYREQIAMFLGQACINADESRRGVPRLVEAANKYPTNYNLLMVTMQNCLDAGDEESMLPLMDRALLMRPDDEQLLNIQGALYENRNEYSKALDAYSRLYDLHPDNLQVNKHLALCYYNLGVEHSNKAITETDQKLVKKYLRQAKAYMVTASNRLGAVVESDPSDAKYVKALAMTYGALGEADRLTQINARLVALGLSPVTVTGMPESIAYNDAAASSKKSGNVPDFQEYARSYVEQSLAKWVKQGEFETDDAYHKRVSEDNIFQEYSRLCKLAEDAYLKKYAGRLRVSDLRLQPYDIKNQSFRIDTDMGPIVVNVPHQGGKEDTEATRFKAQWSGMQFRNLKYYIDDNRVAIASVDIVTPGGKTYTYNADKAANYDFTEVSVDVNSFLEQGSARRESVRRSDMASQREGVVRAQSDVDRDIPITTRRADKTVALVWANENYKNVTEVASALNDGETFARYCRSTLGIPDNQVILLENLTYAEMLSSMRKLRQLVSALGDGVEIIFYYAGHGIPDEATKDSYLLPVDGDGFMTAVTYPLKKLYTDLSSMRASNVMVFLDACFSGATRDGGMLAEARGVALKPRPTDPEGSMYVLSAASDQETALPYKEKNHGLFTYFLLKKLQDSKGNVSLKDLSEYVIENVRKNSLTVNGKVQTPSVKVSGTLSREWSNKKLRP